MAELNLDKSSAGISYPDFTPDVNKSFNRGFTDFFTDGVRKNFCSFNYVKSIGEYIDEVKQTGNNYFILKKNSLNKGDGICFFDKNDELCGTKIINVIENKIFPFSMQGIKRNIKIFRNYNNIFNKQLLNKDTCRKILIKAVLTLSKNNLTLKFIDNENNVGQACLEGFFVHPENPDMAFNIIKENISKTGGTEFEVINIHINSDLFFIPLSILNNLRREAIAKLREKRKKSLIRQKRKKEITYSEYPIKILDYKANILNSSAENFYKNCGVKLIQKSIEKSKIINNKIDLMTTKHCIKYTLGLCNKYFKNDKNYSEPFILSDENNNLYIPDFDCKDCIMYIRAKNGVKICNNI